MALDDVSAANSLLLLVRDRYELLLVERTSGWCRFFATGGPLDPKPNNPNARQTFRYVSKDSFSSELVTKGRQY